MYIKKSFRQTHQGYDFHSHKKGNTIHFHCSLSVSSGSLSRLILSSLLFKITLHTPLAYFPFH